MISSAKIKEFIFDQTVPFDERAQMVVQYQLHHVPAYRLFASQIGHDHNISPGRQLPSLPYLPIELFRSHHVCTDEIEPVLKFASSGTTGQSNSIHNVAEEALYCKSILSGFEAFYGAPDLYDIYALLPSYLEQGQSSLVYMVKYLMDLSGSEHGGFYEYDYQTLLKDLRERVGGRKKMLIGVSFALWEMAEKFPDINLQDVTLMETGGMKGRRKEIIREALHEILTTAFHVPSVHSEYGMTELLSQAWSDGNGVFRSPHWMKFLVRDPYDPLKVSSTGKGVLNIIDLANLYSCSFIASNDVGEVFEDGSFKVLGRMDGSALRGCNLMF